MNFLSSLVKIFDTMYTNSFRKSLALLAVYAVVIIGIFIVQFKNDSIISEKLGSLHITLFESVAEDNSVSLKNKMNVMFNGITFSASDENPATVMVGNKKQAISLVSWKKLSPLSCVFYFTNDVSLKFSISDETPKAYLSIIASMPANVSSVDLSYGLSAGSTVLQESDSKVQIGNKKNAWELVASNINSYVVSFTKRDSVVSYSYFDFTRSFSFANIASLDAASETNYINIIEDYKNNLISAFKQIPADSTTVGEQEVVSYIAAMAEKGKYVEAIDSVPSAFKKSTTRTYLSAPYFNSLEKMNIGLQRQMQTYSDIISYSVDSGVLDVFTVANVADYMCMNADSEKVIKLLTKVASSDVSNIPVSQAAGIINVYVELYEKNKDLASLLQPAVQTCVQKIESQCAADDNIITISESGQFLSVIRAIYAGDAILRYGKITKNSVLQGAGRLIINSYLKNSTSFDLKTLAELYPIIIHGNTFYPHYDVIAIDNGNTVWSWSCANNVGYENDNNGTITLSIDFPISYTHYLIINGIKEFESIYIYDLKFRTDYRFETYNSSGYVHKKETDTLLLKSRQKSEVETIRLLYTTEVVEKSAELIEEDVSITE